MLAYVFWHWPQPQVDPAQYEAEQRAFHQTLAQSAPSGLLESHVFSVSGDAPWLSGHPAYADWYVLDTAAAIDAINAAAVSGLCETPHRALTRSMAAGAGSLFTLRSGTPDLSSARAATLLTKPREMPYPDFDAIYAATPGATPATLWRRALVLGPTPEFLTLSTSPPAFPPTLQPKSLDLAPI